MPALIRFVDEALLPVGDSDGDEKGVTHKNHSGALGIPHVPLDLSGGFDFGVVSIWCCPNSCKDSLCEVVVVQPPTDFA